MNDDGREPETEHEQALMKPSGDERLIVQLMHIAHTLIDDGYGRTEYQPAIVHVLDAIRVLADDFIGRLDREELLHFVTHCLHNITLAGDHAIDRDPEWDSNWEALLVDGEEG